MSEILTEKQKKDRLVANFVDAYLLIGEVNEHGNDEGKTLLHFAIEELKDYFESEIQ